MRSTIAYFIFDNATVARLSKRAFDCFFFGEKPIGTGPYAAEAYIAAVFYSVCGRSVGIDDIQTLRLPLSSDGRLNREIYRAMIGSMVRRQLNVSVEGNVINAEMVFGGRRASGAKNPPLPSAAQAFIVKSIEGSAVKTSIRPG